MLHFDYSKNGKIRVFILWHTKDFIVELSKFVNTPDKMKKKGI